MIWDTSIWKEPVRPKSVTHVTGTFCNPCLRVGPSLLGLPSTVSGKPYSMSAKACSEAEIEHLSRDSYRELMQSRPDLSINVVKILANEVRAVRQALAEILG